jgi:hypothetical protein
MTASEVRDVFETLDASTRARCLVLLCEPCLEHVRKYFADPVNREYRDSVVGLAHEVDVDLPVRAFSAIRKNPDDTAIGWLVVRQALSATGPEDPTPADVDETLARWVAAW